MIKTNVNSKPAFIMDANMDTDNGSELWAKYDGMQDFNIALIDGGEDGWCFDEQALEEAIQFFTMLRDDLILRREG